MVAIPRLLFIQRSLSIVDYIGCWHGNVSEIVVRSQPELPDQVPDFFRDAPRLRPPDCAIQCPKHFFVVRIVLLDESALQMEVLFELVTLVSEHIAQRQTDILLLLRMNGSSEQSFRQRFRRRTPA